MSWEPGFEWEPSPKGVWRGRTGTSPKARAASVQDLCRGWGGVQTLTPAVAPATEGHPSDDHKESHGHGGHSGHNPHSGQQVCGKKGRGFLRRLSR